MAHSISLTVCYEDGPQTLSVSGSDNIHRTVKQHCQIEGLFHISRVVLGSEHIAPDETYDQHNLEDGATLHAQTEPMSAHEQALVRRTMQLINENMSAFSFWTWRCVGKKMQRQQHLMNSVLYKWLSRKCWWALNKWRSDAQACKYQLKDDRIDVTVRYEDSSQSLNVARSSNIRLTVLEHCEIEGLCHAQLFVGSEQIRHDESYGEVGLEDGACVVAKMKPVSQREQMWVRRALHMMNGEPRIGALTVWHGMVARSRRRVSLVKGSLFKWQAAAGMNASHSQMFEALIAFRSAASNA